MNQHWRKFFHGHVSIQIYGPTLEPFINQCVDQGILLTNVKRVDKTRMNCSVGASDIKKLRPILRQHDCKFHTLKREGWPFLLRKSLFRKGTIVGMVLFVAILFVLSNMLWRIQIKGADPEVEHHIRVLLHDIGVKKGAFQFKLPSPEEVQYAITDHLDEVAWVGASLQGTSYKLQVVEKKIPKKEKTYTPRNLVSSKEAVIRDIYVEKGKAMVEPDDYVKEGTLLISGTIGNEDHQKQVPAKGKVIGETWYESEISVPLTTQLKTYTGKKYTKRHFNLFGLHLPIWGFEKPDFSHYDTKKKTIPIHFLKWTLPISLGRTTYLESKETQRVYTKQQAIRVAEKLGKTDLKKKISNGGKVKSGKILRESVQNGKVKVLIYYTVWEDITMEEPLVQNEETE